MNTQLIVKNASKLLKKSGDFLHTNSPTIFAGIAIAGVIGTTVMAVRATLKARDILDEATCNDPDTGEVIEPDTKEKIALTWKQYIPVALMAGLTVGAIVASHNIQNKRNVLLAGLYSTAQKSLEEYQTKTEEVVGKNKAAKIKEEIASDHLQKHPIDRSNVIATGYGDSLCYDVLSGRYFKSDYDKVRKAVNDFNEQLISDDRLPLNELYSLMGLDTIGLGEDIGWVAGDGVKISYKSRLASDGTPCLVIDHDNPPSCSFRNW